MADARTRREALAALSEDEITEFREIFNLVDRDGGGSISKKELADLLDTLGINASMDEIELMVSEIDADGNDEIDFEEFVLVMSRRINTQYSSEDIKNAFKLFATHDSPAGKIHVERVVYALTHFGSRKLGKEEAGDLAAQLEPDADGWVDYEKFVDMMSS